MMARDLNADLATLREVLRLAEQRDFERAADLAAATLRSGFEHPVLLNVMATRLEAQGKFEESLALLERAVAIAPRDIGARNALSLCLQRLERPVEALRHSDELLKNHPELAFAHATRGNALIALGELAQARQSLERALALEPGNLAATVALASIATHRGDHAAARRWAEQALAKAPGLPDAVLSLAAAELAEGKPDHAERLLQGLILDSRAGRLDKARASGLLGDVLDATRRYAEAFAAYAACNGSLREFHRRYAGEANILDYTRSLIASLGRVDPRHWQPPSSASNGASANGASATDRSSEARAHVFLTGFPRSGTTLLELVLDGHPEVATSEERELLHDAVLRFLREPVDWQALALAEESELAPLRGAYWAAVRRAGIDVQGKVFIDKHPLHTLKLPLIARLFPRAKILFARRDPRDVVLGCFRRRFLMNPAVYRFLDLREAAEFYALTMEFAAQVRPLLALDWYEVRYESLVADLPGESRAICRFLGLEWLPEIERFAERAQSSKHATPSTAQLVRGLDRGRAGQWLHYAAALAPVLPVLMPWVQRLGYDAEPVIAATSPGIPGSSSSPDPAAETNPGPLA
jgi:tetratricopeptide (TPR) repeat protein